MRKIRLKTGHRIWFGKGKFDDWCVYVKYRNKLYFYLDKDYFTKLYELSTEYGKKLVFDDFKMLYFAVNKEFDIYQMMQICQSIASHYAENTLVWWIVLYMTMVAEENKANSILGKRIKYLGVYNILIDDWDIDYVCSYMNGMKWYELDELMKERGI